MSDFTPAGLKTNKVPRKPINAPSQLSTILLSYLETSVKKNDAGIQQFRNKAKEMLSSIDVDVDDLHSLLLGYQSHKNFDMAAHFLSEAYARSSVDEIVFDKKFRNIDLYDLVLPKGKTLYVNTHVKRVGRYCDGVVVLNAECNNAAIGDGVLINYAKCDLDMVGSKGALINYGEIDVYSGIDGSGLTVNLGKIRLFEDLKGMVFYDGVLLDFADSYLAQFPDDTDFGIIDGVVVSSKNMLYIDGEEAKTLKVEGGYQISNPAHISYVGSMREFFEKTRDVKTILDKIQSYGPDPALRIKDDFLAMIPK